MFLFLVISVGKHKPKNQQITLTLESSQAFTKRKHILADAVQFACPQPDAHIELVSDAKNDAVGAALHLLVDDSSQAPSSSPRICSQLNFVAACLVGSY